jgi:hypothetical protein
VRTIDAFRWQKPLKTKLFADAVCIRHKLFSEWHELSTITPLVRYRVNQLRDLLIADVKGCAQGAVQKGTAVNLRPLG